MTDPEALARAFHEAYERRAPEHGYETRRDSAVPWDAVPEQNRSLMVAVAGDMLSLFRPDAPTPTPAEQRRTLPLPNPLLAATLDDAPPVPLAAPTPAGDDQREALAHLDTCDDVSCGWGCPVGPVAARPSAPTVTTEQHAAMARGLYVAVYGTRAADQFPDAVQAVGGRLAGIALAALGIKVSD